MAAPSPNPPPADKLSEVSESEDPATNSSNGLHEILIIQDETYSAIKSHFTMQGRGRRPTLPTVPLTNKLLIQLSSLKNEENSSWDVVLTWFLKLFPGQAVTAAQLQYRCQKACSAMESLPQEQLTNFYEHIINVVVQGGLCNTKEEVDALMNESNRVQNLKAQIRYRKVILKETNLCLTGTVSQLYDSLVAVLLDEDVSLVPSGKRSKHCEH